MHRNQKGMSLVEIMVAIAVSAIVIGAAYASYSVINKNYEFQKDVKYMSQTARAVVKMIARDVRMAGYTDFSATQISEAVKITDSSGACCDRIDIIYDKSSSERIKISYYTQQYNNRYRLIKKIDKCTNSDCSSTSTLQSAQPIADYVEDFQLVGTNSGCPTDGTPIAGCGTYKWVSPKKPWDLPDKYPSLFHPSEENRNSKCSVGGAIDGDLNTYAGCGIASGYLDEGIFSFQLDKPMRVTKIRMGSTGTWGSNYGSAPKYTSKSHIGLTGCGSVSPKIKYPYGQHHPFSFNFLIEAVNDKPSCNRCYTAYPYDRGCIHGDFPMEQPTSGISQVLTDRFVLRASNNRVIGYHNGDYRQTEPSQRAEISEIEVYGESYDTPPPTIEVEIGLLLRSPNQHDSKNKSFSMNMGNRDYASNDKYMRDSFSTSVIVRNLYYANQ